MDRVTAREPAAPRAPKAAVSPPPASAQSPAGIAEVRVPDIGDFRDVPVIEVMVKPGDAVEAEDSLVTLESDKATMDVPSPLGGTVRELRVALGDKVSEGTIPRCGGRAFQSPFRAAARRHAARAALNRRSDNDRISA